MELSTLSNYLLIPIVFLIGIVVGFFVGKKQIIKNKIMPVFEKKIDENLKVLHKSEPKTFEQKRSEALEKDKPIIKTFHK